MNILERFLELQRQPTPAPALRALEQQVRQRAVACAEALVAHGAGWEEAAERLGIHARTLRGWKVAEAAGAPAPLGRPCAAAGPAAQQAVLAELQNVGPGVGIPTLRRQFPELARAELTALTQCYRAVWRTQHARLVHVLHWQRPGTVWAMDFAEAPTLIDGVYPYLLAVRDLASGQQLLWRPMLALTAAVVQAELTPLFLTCGAPWVLKTDNGSAFYAEATRGFLGRWQVLSLFSPPRRPSYNGSIEAAIGSQGHRITLAKKTGQAAAVPAICSRYSSSQPAILRLQRVLACVSSSWANSDTVSRRIQAKFSAV